MSAKAIWGRRLRPAIPAPSGCAKSAHVMGWRGRESAPRLLDYSEQMMRAFLAHVPKGKYRAEDFMDSDGISDGPVKIAVTVKFHRAGESPAGTPQPATVDFTGTDSQVEGSINAVEAITYSACFYVFRCLLAEDVPATAGLMRPIRVIAPRDRGECASSGGGGGGECGDLATDCGRLAARIGTGDSGAHSAAASGTMNNLTIGGVDPRTGGPSPTMKLSPAEWAHVRQSRESPACTLI